MKRYSTFLQQQSLCFSLNIQDLVLHIHMFMLAFYIVSLGIDLNNNGVEKKVYEYAPPY